MTKTDLFRIILKVAGIYFLVTVIFNTLPGLLIFMNNTPLLNAVLTIIVILIFAAIFLSLIFNPDFYIKALKLNKGFDDDALRVTHIEFKNVLKIAIVVIGLALFIRHSPSFIINLVFLFKLLLKNQTDFSSQIEDGVLKNYYDWGVKIISLVVGYLMITNYSSIANFIIKKNSKNQKIEQ